MGKVALQLLHLLLRVFVQVGCFIQTRLLLGVLLEDVFDLEEDPLVVVRLRQRLVNALLLDDLLQGLLQLLTVLI